MVNFKLDLKNPEQLSSDQVEELRSLAAVPDSAIDYTDDPRSSADATWTRAENLLAHPRKQLITLRLDSDVLEYFRTTGTRYQSRINAALREYIRKTAGSLEQ
jgi:uncharacterized protein (DUF4415 family)